MASETLSTEELERIRRECGAITPVGDVVALLAEIDRLTAQLQRCNTACDEAKRKADRMVSAMANLCAAMVPTHVAADGGRVYRWTVDGGAYERAKRIAEGSVERSERDGGEHG